MAKPIAGRWAAVVSAAAAVLVLAAACGSDDPATPEPTSSASGDGAFGGAASASPDAAATPTATGGGGGNNGGGTSTPAEQYPKDAKAYQLQFLLAVSANNKPRYSELSNDDQILQAGNSIRDYGAPNNQWTALNCGGNYCNWRNAHGDDAQVSVDTNKLGLPNAITYISLDRTVYATDPVTYVNNFLAAAQAGNRPRLVRLSSDAIATSMAGSGPLDGANDVTDIGGGFQRVDKHPVNRTEPWLSFKVQTSQLGKPNAIKGACASSGCTP